MKRALLAVMILSLFLGVSETGSVANSASSKDGQLLEDATPNSYKQVRPLAAKIDGKYSYKFSQRGVDEIVLPDNLDDSISFSTNRNEIKFRVSRHKNISNQSLKTGEFLTYKIDDHSSLIPLVLEDGSLQINTIIRSNLASHTYEYEFQLQPGSKLEMLANGGVKVLGPKALYLGSIAPAWAKDANGIAVQTNFSISGLTLVQTVAFDQDSEFPIVADPWFGFDMIDQAYWSQLWQYSPTLRVFPTLFGRIADSSLQEAAWSETISKTLAYRSRMTSKSLKVQFDCHWIAVRLYSPNKPSWNLDYLLPYVDIGTEIRYGCNYPANSPEF